MPMLESKGADFLYLGLHIPCGCPVLVTYSIAGFSFFWRLPRCYLGRPQRTADALESACPVNAQEGLQGPQGRVGGNNAIS